MFILAHALQQQDPSLPIPERLGRALAGAGPSISLAAACEALAFGLGGLTSMPAVRNFSLCAAVAVLLDYALQVRRAMCHVPHHHRLIASSSLQRNLNSRPDANHVTSV